jgi:predicted DNA repair protein MutK
VLSAEIIVIALGIVAGHPLAVQVLALAAVAVLMTAAVYGIVAAIVKLDDLGLWLAGKGAKALGGALLAAAPKFMRLLNAAGTAAMFLVGGGILVHGIPALHRLGKAAEGAAGALAGAGLDMLAGFIAGALALSIVGLCRKLRRKPHVLA